jgi:hypothetical protein
MLNPGISLRELQDAFPELSHVFASPLPANESEDSSGSGAAPVSVDERS